MSCNSLHLKSSFVMDSQINDQQAYIEEMVQKKKKKKKKPYVVEVRRLPDHLYGNL
jgi:hypothetical protein